MGGQRLSKRIMPGTLKDAGKRTRGGKEIEWAELGGR